MRSVEMFRADRSPEIIASSRNRYLFIKRALDVVICLSALPVMLVMIGIIALVIALDSPGSPFFVQDRVGKNGRRFRLYKFRTMRADYDDPQARAFMQAYIAGQLGEGIEDRDAMYKPIKKQDITRVGRFLRKASLDELPQVLNVLKGEMSIIGPRPNVLWEVDAYHDWHHERLVVLPGITGLAQIHGRSNITFDEIVQYDIQYVRNVSLKLDLQILWRTVWIVVASRGAG